MALLVTGAAGFIGFHVCAALLRAGETVIGVDKLTPCQDFRLKPARLEALQRHRSFSFYKLDLAERGALDEICTARTAIETVIIRAGRRALLGGQPA